MDIWWWVTLLVISVRQPSKQTPLFVILDPFGPAKGVSEACSQMNSSFPFICLQPCNLPGVFTPDYLSVLKLNVTKSIYRNPCMTQPNGNAVASPRRITSNNKSLLTGLNDEELLGLCTHFIWGSAVIAPEVIFRLWGYLEEEGGNEGKYVKGSVPKQMCQTPWRWPFCLSIRVAYFCL